MTIASFAQVAVIVCCRPFPAMYLAKRLSCGRPHHMLTTHNIATVCNTAFPRTMLSNRSQATNSSGKVLSGSEQATEFSTRPTTVASASSAALRVPDSYNSTLGRARQGNLSRDPASKIDIFASLPTCSGQSQSDADVQSSIILAQEQRSDKLYREIERMLGDIHSGENEDKHQRYSGMDANGVFICNHEHDIHRFDMNGVNGFEHMQRRLENFNESVTNVASPHLPPVKTEYDIYDNERLKRLRDEHIANPGARRQQEKIVIKERMSKAEREGDKQAYQQAALEKRLLNHEIMLDFRATLLNSLGDDMKGVIAKRLVDIDQTYDTLQAQLAMSMRKGHTLLQLVDEAETARKEALIQVEDVLQAIDDGHLVAADYFFQTANHLVRKSTTRFRRLDAHDVPKLRREEVMRQRLQDPAAAPFIARAHHELDDAKTISEMVGLSAEKIGVHMSDLEVALKDLERMQEGALLSSLQSGVLKAGRSTGRFE